MLRTRLACVLALALVLSAVPAANAASATAVRPPVAKTAEKTLEAHGLERQDPYYWLAERENPEVISYLEAENAYTATKMEHTQKLQERLFKEFKKRVKQTDVSVPALRDGWYYYSRTQAGKDYPIHCRKKGSLEAREQVILDVNEMAEGHEFYSVGQRAVTPDGNLVAYPVDTAGRRIYTIEFKNLATGQPLPDRIPEVTSNLVWANDNKTLFYVKQDPTTLRSYRVYRHVLGTDPAADALIYEEQDDTFGVFVGKTRSKRYLLIGSYQTLSTEFRYLDANDPSGEFRIFEPRRRDHEYSVDHHGDFFYIRTNDGAKNFRLMRTPVERTARDGWEEVIGHRDDVLLEDFELFRDHMVVIERERGLLKLRVRPFGGGSEHYLDFGEPTYTAAPTSNFEFDTATLRYEYTSLTTPDSLYDYDMNARTKTLLKREEVGLGFDPEDWVTDRLWAKARDGVEVPISIVHRKGIALDGSHPLLLYGYGSYGASMDATFNPFLISLLERGFVYAIAHIRGGQELGRSWYEDGKLLKKKNTFTDFIDCGEFLVARGYTKPDRLFAQGGSAGGLLIGAVVNMRPDLFRGALAQVPFVDVVTTMLDASIPLTTGEYDEWGNPNDRMYYDYMLSYSPYDNVEAKAYPALLVTTGLHDSQVQYFEPAKWVARLRAMKTDSNPLLLKTRMQAGHGGASARDQRYRDTAFNYAFLLDLAGVRR